MISVEQYGKDLNEVTANLIKIASDLVDLLKKSDDTNKKMKSLLERLTPKKGLYVLDEFENRQSCIFCHYPQEYHINLPSHKEDCPWDEARKLLEKLK
jgi:hypothetical protein